MFFLSYETLYILQVPFDIYIVLVVLHPKTGLGSRSWDFTISFGSANVRPYFLNNTHVTVCTFFNRQRPVSAGAQAPSPPLPEVTDPHLRLRLCLLHQLRHLARRADRNLVRRPQGLANLRLLRIVFCAVGAAIAPVTCGFLPPLAIPSPGRT